MTGGRGMTGWLQVSRGDAPLIVALPHTGVDLADVGGSFRSRWLALHDADWWVDRLYAFAAEKRATLVRTAMARSVIDVNRDPSGASLYPGQTTTELCPTTLFDGTPIHAGDPPDAAEIARRRTLWFMPYHTALTEEIGRLRARHRRVVLYDAHSILSHVPRLFEGRLPQFNIGTNGGRSCDPALSAAVAGICAESGESHVVNGRFRGGWTTRHHGRPEDGVHAIQMELAMRGYLDEPEATTPENWPRPWDEGRAARLAPTLSAILNACIAFAKGPA